MLNRGRGTQPTERRGAALPRVRRASATRKITAVVLADADTLFRTGLHEAAAEVLPDAAFSEVGSYEALLATLRQQPSDLVLLDLGLPGLNGYLSLLALRQQYPAKRFVAVSGIDAPAVRQRALAFGIARFISKRASRDAIAATLTIATGPRRSSGRPPARERRLIEGLFALTRAELNVLAALPDNPSHRHIMKSLGIALPTVKTHMSRILAKLGLRNRTEAAIVASKLASFASPSLCLDWTAPAEPPGS